MKRTILVIAAAALTLIGTQAFANHWGGSWSGPMAGYHGGNHQGFSGNTAQLRQELAAKQGEYQALVATTNPDPKRHAELSREITVLQDQLAVQARAYNLHASNAGYHGRMGGYRCRW